MCGGNFMVGAKLAMTLLGPVSSKNFYSSSHGQFDNVIVSCSEIASDSGLKPESAI